MLSKHTNKYSNTGQILMTNHIPVMLDETVKSLKIIKNGCYVDATFGSGGHSTEILNNLGPNGKLFSLDKIVRYLIS